MFARSLAIGLLATLLLASVVQAKDAPLSHGYVRSEGIAYYQAFGTTDTVQLVNHGDDTGPYEHTFTGCAFTRLRPETTGGRIRMSGLLDDKHLLDLDFDNFLSPDGVTPGVMPNVELDGRFGQDPPVDAEMAVWGEATIRVRDNNFTEPVGDQERFDASFFVVKDGLHDDRTGNVTEKVDDGDWEIHLRVQTPSDAVPKPQQFRFEQLGDTPLGLSPNEAYSERVPFQNFKFGGTGHLTIAATSSAPPGENDYTIAITSPTGKALANVSMTPSLMQDQTETVDIPLSEFGVYLVDIRGVVSFTSYSIDFDLQPPEKGLDMRVVWDEVWFADDARAGWNDCEFGYAQVPGSTIGRAQPPDWLMPIVIAGVLGAVTTVLLVVKVIGESYSDMTMRKRFGGK